MQVEKEAGDERAAEDSLGTSSVRGSEKVGVQVTRMRDDATI